jgi:hypothetical protein
MGVTRVGIFSTTGKILIKQSLFIFSSFVVHLVSKVCNNFSRFFKKDTVTRTVSQIQFS